MEFSHLLNKLNLIAENTDISFYMIGGAVRDMILGKHNITDIDIAVEKRFSRFINMFIEETKPDKYYISPLKTARISFGTVNVDIVTARKEYYDKPGMMPVIKASHIDDDIRRRDFTINSIAYNIRTNTYYDPLKGMEDLKKGIIRENRPNLFEEDPTRIFRLIRYSRRLGFRIETDTENDLLSSLKSKHLFKYVSKSRISSEFKLIMKENNTLLCLEDIMSMNLMNIITGTHVNMNTDNYDSSSSLLGNIVMIFLNNDIETILIIADILNNGARKSQIADIKNIHAYINNQDELKHHIEKKYRISIKRKQQ